MSGKTLISTSDENASVPTEHFSWQSEAESRGHYDWQDFSIWDEEETKKRRQYNFAESAEGCRNVVMDNAEAVGWLRNTLLGNFCGEPCMQSPAKQTVAYFLLGELPTQLEDLCELALEGKPPSWRRKLLSNFVVGAK